MTDIPSSLSALKAGAKARQDSRREFREAVNRAVASLTEHLRVGDAVSITDWGDPFGGDALYQVREVMWPVCFERPVTVKNAVFAGDIARVIVRKYPDGSRISYADPRTSGTMKGKPPGVVMGGVMYDATLTDPWASIPIPNPQPGQVVRLASHEDVLGFADHLEQLAAAFAEKVAAEADKMRGIADKLRWL